jgi:chemotaxis protein methyltransferase CheR
MIAFSPRDFETVTKVLRARSGISLSPNKAYLLEARVAPLLARYNLKSAVEFTQALSQDRNGTLVNDFIEGMTTNETLFFRDQRPFDLLANDVLPRLRLSHSTQKRIRIWCAAASTGQEPYSLAMYFRENQNLWHGWDIDIFATDLSRAAITKAKRGTYSQFEVQRGLPIRLLMKYFTQNGNDWTLAQEIRDAVRYQHHNLLSGFEHFGQFDIILIRNVLIYFDAEGKKAVIERIGKALTDEGHLILGAAETTLHYTDAFKPVKPDGGLYVKSAFASTMAAAAPLHMSHAVAASTRR